MTHKLPFPPGSLVAAYFRDSGGDTQELSIAQQESYFREWCQRSGYIPGQVFRDEARRGSSTIGRQGFQDMMHYFRSGEATEAGLVIWNYQRFARDIDDSQYFRADIRRRGYGFHSLNDDIPDGPMGRLFEAVIDWKNEQFLEDLSRDVKRGLHDLVRRYGAVPGTPPRGFRREAVQIGTRRDGRPHVAHRWVPDPERAPQVALAFQMRAEGRSLSEIHAATRLYGSINSYTTFFANKLYAGVLEFGDLVIEDYCAPLVDAQTWQAVQEQIESHAAKRNLSGENRSHPRRQASRYLLSGLAFCALCGAPLNGLTAPNHERYICSRAKRRRDCEARPVPRHTLDDAVIRALVEQVLTMEALSQMQAEMTQTRDEVTARLAQHAGDLRRQLAGVRRRLANVTEAIAESGNRRALLEKLASLEKEENNLLGDLAGVERQMDALHGELTEADMQAVVDDYRRVLAGSGESGELRRLLSGFVERITVERDGQMVRGMIRVYFPPNKGPPAAGSVSMAGATLGALSQRHTYTVDFIAYIRVYRKRR